MTRHPNPCPLCGGPVAVQVHAPAGEVRASLEVGERALDPHTLREVATMVRTAAALPNRHPSAFWGGFANGLDALAAKGA